jgi:hypothetical protein
MTTHGRGFSKKHGIVRSDRWMAEITYLTGRPADTAVLEEILDLDPIIEHGPDWHEIDRIVLTLNRPATDPAALKRDT